MSKTLVFSLKFEIKSWVMSYKRKTYENKKQNSFIMNLRPLNSISRLCPVFTVLSERKIPLE